MTTTRKALLIIDVQNDFCEGGSLAVAGGAQVASDIAGYLVEAWDHYDAIYATQDWHEPDTVNGGHIALPPAEPDFVDTWPVHCIANTEGAKIHPNLSPTIKALAESGLTIPRFRKGYGMPAYSGFEGWNQHLTRLDITLAKNDITSVDVVGIAADYCVASTAKDSILRNFETRVLEDLTVGIHRTGSEVAAEIEKEWQERRALMAENPDLAPGVI